MDSLFGVEVTGAARFVVAFVVVLALIAVTAWLVRRFGSGALGSAGGRGRQPRLAVIDAASIDARRKLILVRRDNVEHLVMIGGPSDVVIEPNIVRATTAAREPSAPRAAPIPETMPRPVPLEEGAMWPLQPEPAPRPQRPAPPVAAEWSAASHQQTEATLRTAHPDTLAELAEALTPRTPPHAEPEPPAMSPPQTAAPYATATTDPHLAEMAQRLEAVLRRSGPGEAQQNEPTITPHAADEAPDAVHPVAPHDRPADPEPHTRDAKKFYETLEQEMASLLGRPTGKT